MEMKDCKMCPRMKNRTRVVPYSGAKHPMFLFIGEAPGAEEDAKGIPFVGAAGAKLRAKLKSLGISEDLVAFTNICKCRPPENATPMDIECSNCSQFLEHDIKSSNPFVIIPLGNTAMRRIINAKSITKEVGQVYRVMLFGVERYVVPQIHPSALLHNPNNVGFWDTGWATINSIFKDSMEEYKAHLFVENTNDEQNKIIESDQNTNDEKNIKIENVDISKRKAPSSETGHVFDQVKTHEYLYGIEKVKEQMFPDENFVHLHCHTENSLLDAFSRMQSIVNKNKMYGFKACAITDHGTMGGAYEFYDKMRAVGLKPILGSEVYVTDKNAEQNKIRKRGHLVLLAKSQKGYQNLLKIVSFSHIEGYYFKPCAWIDLIKKYHEDIICLTACQSSWIALNHEDLGSEETKENHMAERVLTLLEIFGDDLYLEVSPHDDDTQIEWNKIIYSIANNFGIKIVATNDCHYVSKDDEPIHDILINVSSSGSISSKDAQENKKGGRPIRHYSIKDLYIKTRQEMYDTFLKQGLFKPEDINKMLDETMRIAEKVQGYDIHKGKTILPNPPIPEFFQKNNSWCYSCCKSATDECIENHMTVPISAETHFFLSLVYKGFDEFAKYKKFDNEKIEKYKERLMYEIEMIEGKNFIKYFLVINEYLAWCRENGILYQARGSVGGSLIARCLRFTEVDPIELDLFFERFISPDRDDYPDIDIDVMDNRREEVVDHLRELYGKNSIAQIGTPLTMSGKLCLHDVSRVFGLPLSEVGTVAFHIIKRSGGDARADYTISDSFEQFAVCQEFDKKYPQIKPICTRLEGHMRSRTSHASAFVVAPFDIWDITPIERAGKGGAESRLVAAYPPKVLEDLGLLKLDILGLKTLTVIDETVKKVKELTGKEIDWFEIDAKDEATYEQLKTGQTVGVFEMESLGMAKLCKRIKVRDFEDLVSVNALHRPGTLNSGLTAKFIERRNGLEPVPLRHPMFDELTKTTYGICVYQEQTLGLLRKIGKLSWSKVNYVRKIIKHSQGVEVFNKERELFIKGAMENGFEHELADKIFNEVENFGSYAFNKAHAALYALTAFKTMYLKVHYPLQFISSALKHPKKEESLTKYISEARRLGIEVIGPDINRSSMHYDESDSQIVCGLLEINGIGQKIAEEIVSCRPYRNVTDYLLKVEKAKSDKVMETLINSGAFDSLFPNRKALANNWQKWKANKQSKQQSKLDLFGLQVEDNELFYSISEEDYSDEERNKKQMKVLTMPPAEHPILRYYEILDEKLATWARNRIISIGEIDFDAVGKYYNIIVLGMANPSQMNFKIVGMEGGAFASSATGMEGAKYVHINCEDFSDFVLLHISPRMYNNTKYKTIIDAKYAADEPFPILAMGSVNPNPKGARYTKIYVSDFIIIDDFLNKKPEDHTDFEKLLTTEIGDIDALDGAFEFTGTLFDVDSRITKRDKQMYFIKLTKDSTLNNFKQFTIWPDLALKINPKIGKIYHVSYKIDKWNNQDKYVATSIKEINIQAKVTITNDEVIDNDSDD